MGKSILKFINLNMILLLFIILSCSPKLKKQVKLLEQAHNNHDIEKVLSFYTDDSRFVLVGGWVAEGKDHLRKRFEWDFAVNGSLKFLDCKTNKDTVTCTVEERNDIFKMLNIDVVYYEYAKLIYKDGFVKEIQAELTQESNRRIEKAFSSFIRWASSEQTEALDELRMNDQLLFVEEKADKWFLLLQMYRDVSSME